MESPTIAWKRIERTVSDRSAPVGTLGFPDVTHQLASFPPSSLLTMSLPPNVHNDELSVPQNQEEVLVSKYVDTVFKHLVKLIWSRHQHGS